MKQVRLEIGHQLIDALHQCNMADVKDEDYNANDINTKCSRQHEAYGHISNALTSLGFNRAREVYASEGDIDAAHEAIGYRPSTRKSRLEDEAEASRFAGNQIEHIDMVGGVA